MSTATPDTSPSPPQTKRTPEQHYQWQSADAQGANQQLEILDKVRTSNMLFRGQKQLSQLVELRNRILYGKDAVDAVTIPEDDTRINCPEIHNHYGDKAAAAPVASGVASSLLPSLLKIGVGAALAGTGIGLPFALPSIISGIGDLMKTETPAVAPADPGGAGVINVNGHDYQLNLEDE